MEGSARTAGSEASIRGQYRTITPGYFRTLGIPLLHGRAFDAGDRDGTRLVAIVNETAERRHFGGHAVGRRLISGNGSEPYEVVGVVGDIRHESARSEPLPEVYYALAQEPSRRMWLAVRTTGNPSDVAGRVRQVLTTLDPEVPVDHVRTMAERREAALGVSTFLAALLTGFALLALGLACVGHYGVVSYGVARRTHEIGMRLVLGASPGGVLRMVVRETLSVAVGGVLLAVPLAALASRVLSSFLYGVAPGDPLIFATAAGLMLATAAAAAFLPAWRASRVEAVSALRHE